MNGYHMRGEMISVLSLYVLIKIMIDKGTSICDKQGGTELKINLNKLI